MVKIKFGVPWMSKPERLLELINETKSQQKEIDYVYFRPADLEFENSLKVLKKLQEQETQVFLTTSSRSGVNSLDIVLKDLFNETIIPDKIIVDQHSIRQVHSNKQVLNKNIGLYLSTIAGINEHTYKNLFSLKKEFPALDYVCLHHDSSIFNINLKKIAKEIQENGITPVLLANESCFNNCPHRENHFNHLALKHPLVVDNYQNLCLDIRFNNPLTLKTISGFIHPLLTESFSEKTGINHFKITGMPSRGRNRAQEESEKTILAYLFGETPSDLMEVACFTYLKKGGSYRFGLDEQAFLKYQSNLLKGFKEINDEGVIIRNGLSTYEKDSAEYAKVAQKINMIYKNHNVLPWTGLPLPDEIKKILLEKPKETNIHFSGSGLGEHVNEVYGLGYINISCSDISDVAIMQVRQKYPFLESYALPTQQLNQTNWQDKYVFDLHNFHNVSPNQSKTYLQGLKSIAKELVISWIYEPNLGRKIESDVSELGIIYHHEPSFVEAQLSDFEVVKRFNYKLKNNSDFFVNRETRLNKMFGLHLRRRK